MAEGGGGEAEVQGEGGEAPQYVHHGTLSRQVAEIQDDTTRSPKVLDSWHQGSHQNREVVCQPPPTTHEPSFHPYLMQSALAAEMLPLRQLGRHPVRTRRGGR